MAKTVLQSAGSIILSILVAVILLVVIEGLGAILHPFPSDFGGSSDEVVQHVANSPFWVLILLGGAGWAVTIFSATWLATRLGTNRHPAHGVGIGLLLLGAAVFNMAMLPYPVWFWILNLLLLPAGIYFGVSHGMAKSTEVI